MPIQPSQSRHDLPWWREAVRLRRHILSLKAQTRLLRRDLAAKKYNPNQPRVPAGNSDGGQWSSGASGGGGAPGIDLSGLFGDLVSGLGAAFTPSPVVADVGGTESWASYQDGTRPDGSLAEQAVVNRDGSTIHSEYAAPGKASDWDERHTVTLPDGSKTTFETRDRTQTIRAGGPDGEIVSRATWTERGPEPEATVQLAFAPLLPLVPPAAEATITAGLTLFTWLSARNKLDGLQAVIGFNAREFQATGTIVSKPDFVANLTEKEVDRVCNRREFVQKLAEEAIRDAGDPSNYPNAGAYGSAVHYRVKKPIDNLKDPDFRAELSTFKLGVRGEGERRYGLADTWRTDVVERVNETTVCGYDIKTGNAEVDMKRAIELVFVMKRLYPNATRFLIMQIKPGRQ